MRSMGNGITNCYPDQVDSFISITVLTVFSCTLLVVTFAMVAVPAQDADTITKVQKALKEKGFDPGPIDGLIGPRTSKALREFQIQKDIQVTGQINKETLDGLGLKGGLMGRVGSGFKTAGGAVAGAATTAAGATARGAKVAADASVTAAGATASGAKAAAGGATTGAKATAKGATTGAKATASGAQTGGKAIAKGAKATAGGATAGGKAVASGATKGAKAATGWLPGGKGGDLASRVESKLKKDSGVDAEQIEVRTEGKNVYLIFSGGTQAQMNRAVVVARKVDGVDNVFIRLPE